jgi:hypothetical protein
MVVAQDRRGARTIMRFVTGLLQSVPMLKRQISGITQESVTLKNNIIIEIHTASFRSTRGYTILAALLDEIAFWPVDDTAAEQDTEVINAIRPGMATVPDAMLLCASSPYARKGALWNAHSRHFGKDGDPVLVWQATIREMNITVPQSFIDAHMQACTTSRCTNASRSERNWAPYSARARDSSSATSVEVYERAYDNNFSYAGFVDPGHHRQLVVRNGNGFAV